jgi:hypothetical protein
MYSRWWSIHYPPRILQKNITGLKLQPLDTIIGRPVQRLGFLYPGQIPGAPEQAEPWQTNDDQDASEEID